MSADAEKIAKLAALCDEREHGPGPGWAAVDEVRAILAEPGPAVPAHDIDRDALLDVLLDYDQNEYSTRQTADRILALVRPVEGVWISREEAAALDTFDVSVWGEPGSPFANGAAAMLSRVRAILVEVRL